MQWPNLLLRESNCGCLSVWLEVGCLSGWLADGCLAVCAGRLANWLEVVWLCVLAVNLTHHKDPL